MKMKVWVCVYKLGSDMDWDNLHVLLRQPLHEPAVEDYFELVIDPEEYIFDEARWNPDVRAHAVDIKRKPAAEVAEIRKNRRLDLQL